ncbi:hypothetical protein ABPG74_015246 [Tetrahymena malaccensis]
MKIIAILVLEIVLIFAIAISSLQIALQYTKEFMNEFGENIFQNEIEFSGNIQSIISFRLTREIFKLPANLNVINSFHEKIIQGNVNYNNKYKPSILNIIQTYYSQINPDYYALLTKNQMLVNSWFQQNASQINQLDLQGQQVLYNYTRSIPLMNAIYYQSQQNASGIITLPYIQIQVFNSQTGLAFTNFVNSSLQIQLDTPNCYKGLYSYTPSCRFFYVNSLNQTSVFMNPPQISASATPPYISQYVCQRAMYYDQQKQNIENNRVLCILLKLSNIYNYFQNIIQSSKQYYVIDPRTLQVYFNSKKQYNYSNITEADNFYKIELQYLENQDQSQEILKFIQDNYNTWVFSQQNDSYVNILQMLDLSKKVIAMDYKRNGTTYKAIFNPIIQYDQIPKFITKYTKKEGLLLEYAYLQINIISNEDLKTQTNKILDFFSKLYIAVQAQIDKPIIRMTQTLQKINQLKQLVDISQIIKKYEEKAKFIFLSKETYLLYQSFLDLFEMIQYTSESFFIENEGKNLISLSKKVDFFTKFKNYNAAGVTYNNIGNILLNQQHYFQALEHFSMSIMYAKYEISAFLKSNPDSFYQKLLQYYSFSEQLNQKQETLSQRQTNSQNFFKAATPKSQFIKSSQQIEEKKSISEKIKEQLPSSFSKQKQQNPELQYLNIFMNCLMSKCYYNQFQYFKAKQKFAEAQNMLTNFRNQGQAKIQENIYQNFKNISSQKENFFDLLQKNQSKQSQFADLYQLSPDLSNKFGINILKSQQNRQMSSKNLNLDLIDQLNISQINLAHKQSQNQEFNDFYSSFETSQRMFINKKQAAEILTDLYESSQNMTSNLPFRIVFKLKQIFDVYNIQDFILYQEYSRFNKNLSLQVAVCFEYTKSKQDYPDDKNNSTCQNFNLNTDYNFIKKIKEFSNNQIQFMQELSYKVLYKDIDKITLFTVDQDERCVVQNVNLISSKLFRQFQDNIFNEANILKQSIFKGQNNKNKFDKSQNSELFSLNDKQINVSQHLNELQIEQDLFSSKNKQQINQSHKKYFISDLNLSSVSNPYRNNLCNNTQNQIANQQNSYYSQSGLINQLIQMQKQSKTNIPQNNSQEFQQNLKNQDKNQSQNKEYKCLIKQFEKFSNQQKFSSIYNKMKIITILVPQIVLIFAIAITSLQIALQYTDLYMSAYGQNIFQKQIEFSSNIQSTISFRLSREIFKIPVNLNIINSLNDKIIQGRIKYNPSYKPSIANIIQTYYNNISSDLSEMATKNSFLINSWYQQNASQISQLDFIGQQILHNQTLLIPLTNTIQQQAQRSASNVTVLPYRLITLYDSNQGAILSNFVNSSLQVQLDSHNCYKGLFNYDPRCRYFYLNSLNQTSIYMNPPQISVATIPPYLSQHVCQRTFFFNQLTLQIENNHVLCIELMLTKIQNYFQSILQSSKQYYVIDPRSLLVFFNSKKQNNFINVTKADQFYDIELKYLQDQNQSQEILKFIQDNYNTWVFSQQNNSYVNIQQMLDLSQRVIIKNYNRNGTSYKAIFNPIIQYDQIPKYITKYTKKEGLLLEYAYLQINIISDEDLKTQTNKILNFFSNLFIAVQVQINKPIIRMTQTLEKINQLKELVDISHITKKYQEKQKFILLSKETYLLYQSFLDLFEMIQYTSESFFIENEGKNLISLSKKVDFFTKFKNYNAAGVTHNNIGNILLNQQHYFQALEHFQMSIMYAKYEISEFLRFNPDSVYQNLLYLYSFSEKLDEQLKIKSQCQINSQSFQILTTPQTQLLKPNLLTEEKKSNNQKVEAEIKSDQKQNTFQSKYDKQLIKQISDKLQVQELILNLIYRKQNYIITLVAYQEHIDQKQKITKSSQGFYFWKEIKNLIKDQIKLINIDPELQYLKVFMNCLISKCQYNQFQYFKAKYKIIEAQNMLLSQTNQGQLNVLDSLKQESNSQDATQLNQVKKSQFEEFNQLSANLSNEFDIGDYLNSQLKQQGLKYLNQDFIESANILLKNQSNQLKNKNKGFNNIQNNFESSQRMFEYRKAAETLTDLYESSQNMATSLPFRIIFKLKQIFDIHHIQDINLSTQSQNLNSRFNKSQQSETASINNNQQIIPLQDFQEFVTKQEENFNYNQQKLSKSNKMFLISDLNSNSNKHHESNYQGNNQKISNLQSDYLKNQTEQVNQMGNIQKQFNRLYLDQLISQQYTYKISENQFIQNNNKFNSNFQVYKQFSSNQLDGLERIIIRIMQSFGRVQYLNDHILN